MSYPPHPWNPPPPPPPPRPIPPAHAAPPAFPYGAHPGPAYAPWQPPLTPASQVRVILASMLDQVVLLATFVFWLGTGILASGAVAEQQSGVVVTVGVIVGAVLALAAACTIVGLVARVGSSFGLFLLSTRFDPREDVDVHDGVEWLVGFWEALVWLPLIALLSLFGRPKEPGESASDCVRDVRAQTAGARAVRALSALALVVAPVPLLVALAT